MSREVLLAVAVTMRSPGEDAGERLREWAIAAGSSGVQITRREAGATAGVLDDMDRQPFLLSAARAVRSGLTVGCHLGTRTSPREASLVQVSDRSADGAYQLALAAGDGELVVSGDLGAFLTASRARLAGGLQSLRLRVNGVEGNAYRLHVTVQPGERRATPRSATALPAIVGSVRERLFERLEHALMPHLGPIAPLLLQQLPMEKISSEELIEAVLRDVPPAQRAAVRQVIEEEVGRLR